MWNVNIAQISYLGPTRLLAHIKNMINTNTQITSPNYVN